MSGDNGLIRANQNWIRPPEFADAGSYERNLLVGVSPRISDVWNELVDRNQANLKVLTITGSLYAKSLLLPQTGTNTGPVLFNSSISVESFIRQQKTLTGVSLPCVLAGETDRVDGASEDGGGVAFGVVSAKAQHRVREFDFALLAGGFVGRSVPSEDVLDR